ncbi:MAG: redoxin domain-containing protein [bacterium]
MYLLKRGSTRAPAIRPVDWAGETDAVPDPRGRTLLLDFFSYGDPAGVLALPRLAELAERYRAAGLSVVGVHVPAYDFERPLDVARREIWRLGVPYPVALDHGFEIFRAYGLRDLPARVLVDGAGFVRGWEQGGGELDLLEPALRTLLAEGATARPIPPPLTSTQDRTGGLRWRPTGEIRFGTRAVGFGPPDAREGVEGDEREFPELPELRAEGVAYLEGKWVLGRDRVVTTGDSCGLAVVFEGVSVAAVLSLPDPESEPMEAALSLDGVPPDAETKGGDVELSESGAALTIDRGGVYELICSREFGIHNLDLRIRGSGVAVHLLHFGTMDVPELA